MSLRIFEDPVEVAESPQPGDVSFWARIAFCGGALLVTVIPGYVTTYAALGITNLFRGMTNAESASAANVLDNIHVFNRPLVIALGISALLSFVTALVLATNEKLRFAAVGFPLSIGVPITAATPALFLWFAETTIIDVMTGKITDGPISVIAQRIGNLLFSAAGLGLLSQGATFVGAVISLCIPVKKRSDPSSPRRAFTWAISGVLLLVFAGAYFVLV
jgi:hypothetical protein